MRLSDDPAGGFSVVVREKSFGEALGGLVESVPAEKLEAEPH